MLPNIFDGISSLHIHIMLFHCAPPKLRTWYGMDTFPLMSWMFMRISMIEITMKQPYFLVLFTVPIRSNLGVGDQAPFFLSFYNRLEGYPPI
jgi:hypothetical protein